MNTRKDFARAAAIAPAFWYMVPEPARSLVRASVTSAFVVFFEQSNPRFDRARFEAAIAVEDERQNRDALARAGRTA